jgi:hypothetical protein
MVKHGSASVRKDTPHSNSTDPSQNPNLSRSIRRRAFRIINNQAIDSKTRGMLRYALGINDPWTPSLVRRAEAREVFGDTFSLTGALDQTIDERLEALTGLICRPGNEPDTKSGALLLLMSTIQDSNCPKELANTAKLLAFMRCCELNLCGMVANKWRWLRKSP